MQPRQPKINQKLLLRSAIGLFALAALIFAYLYFKGNESDPFGNKSLNTVGWIAAIQTTGDSQHALVFKDDRSVVEQPNASATVLDRDVAWRPDGNYVFFSSNRDKNKFTMFRWYPAPKSEAEMRSIPGLVQGSPYFEPSDSYLHNAATALVVVGGTVMELDPKRPALHQVLPPPNPTMRTEGGDNQGELSPFESYYQHFGTSFKSAEWSPDKKAVYAVMRRESGEILIYQRLDFDPKNPQAGAPQELIAGDRVDFDVDPNSGVVYYAVENFQWPFPDQLDRIPDQFKKNGKVTVPYRHGLGVFDPSAPDKSGVLFGSNKDEDCFSEVAVAPGGDKLAMVHGKYQGNGNIASDAILVVGLSGSAKGKIGKAVSGEVFEPSWSPDDKTIAFAQRLSASSRPIFTWSVDDPVARRRSPEDGVYSHPVFSPQKAQS